MPKPTKQDLSGLDYSWLGQPFVRYAAKSTINTSDLDYSFLAQPFVTAGDVIFASSSFAVTASCSQNILAEAIQSQQEEENTIFKVYAQWRNIYSKYKLY